MSLFNDSFYSSAPTLIGYPRVKKCTFLPKAYLYWLYFCFNGSVLYQLRLLLLAVNVSMYRGLPHQEYGLSCTVLRLGVAGLTEYSPSVHRAWPQDPAVAVRREPHVCGGIHLFPSIWKAEAGGRSRNSRPSLTIAQARGHLTVFCFMFSCRLTFFCQLQFLSCFCMGLTDWERVAWLCLALFIVYIPGVIHFQNLH